MQQMSFIRYESPNTLKTLPLKERPAQRLRAYGPKALSMTEVLAALVGGARQLEVAAELVARFQTVEALARAPLAELEGVKGLGAAGAARLKAALELGRRLLAETPEERPQITCPADAANLVLTEMGLLEKEELHVMLLDTRNRVIGRHVVYRGSLNTCLVRVAELFREAIRQMAASIIVLHNHPSGSPEPSPEDVALTRMVVEAGELMDIQVLDHLVIGRNRYVSLKERNLGFS